MAVQLPLHASPAVPDAAAMAPVDAIDEPAPTALAFFTIESFTFGEFKQVVRVPFYAGQIIRIGTDSKKCNLRFKSSDVAPVHCEIYSVTFDQDEPFPTLIYVRDCQSTTGTFVNGGLVGKEPFVAPARLLENGDTITVGPCTVRLCEYAPGASSAPLTPLQRREAAMFASDYTIKDTILGSGTYAKVYLAADVKAEKQVVCKIHDISALCQGAIDRVDREMSIWSLLDHPNIVAFHRAYKTSNTVFTFADLATGGDLYSMMEREQTIPEIEMKWILFQLLRAVDYLHCKGVAHRDIKPENVLCASSFHMHHRVALADFGCAGATKLGRLTSHVGTGMYRAPEVQQTTKPHGVAVDIWSLGVLAVQLLAGYESIDDLQNARTEAEIQTTVVVINARRAEQVNGPISQVGLDFILACLSPDPGTRPSAAMLAKHLWFRESAQQILEFQDREKQLVWRPRNIVFPAVVRLPDVPVEPAELYIEPPVGALQGQGGTGAGTEADQPLPVIDEYAVQNLHIREGRAPVVQSSP